MGRAKSKFPYLTLKARSKSLAGPWGKQQDVVPFRCQPSTYYEVTASPAHIMKHGDEYLMFFSATNQGVRQTLSMARTKDLNGPWADGLDGRQDLTSEHDHEPTTPL
jgi:beta-xylosidase